MRRTALSLLLLLTPLAMAQDAAPPEAFEVGLEVPSFFVREVTTERPNLATCLVCRYGNRPVVLLCIRRLDAPVEQLLARIDEAVDAGRGRGLKGFAIFVGDEPYAVQPRLMDLVRRQGITLPLTIPVETEGPQELRPPQQANLTVLCYAKRKVVAAHVLQSEELTPARIGRILDDVQQLVAQ